MRRALAFVGSLVLVAIVCGCGGANADDVLQDTAANLGKIRSGNLELRLLVEPTGANTGKPFGFRLQGPFSLGRGGGALPVLKVRYTQIANGREATVTLVSTGKDAYVDSKGERIPLTAEQKAELSGAAGQLRASGGLARFPIGDWTENADVSDGGEVGGADTQHVSADLKVVNVANDLLALAGAFGQNVSQLQGRSAEELARSVRSSHFDLYTGKDDRLLRKLELRADLGLDVPAALRNALGALVGARVTFLLAVDDPNEPVAVSG